MRDNIVNLLENYETVNIATVTGICDGCFTVNIDQYYSNGDSIWFGDEDQEVTIKNVNDWDLKQTGLDEYTLTNHKSGGYILLCFVV